MTQEELLAAVISYANRHLSEGRKAILDAISDKAAAIHWIVAAGRLEF